MEKIAEIINMNKDEEIYFLFKIGDIEEKDKTFTINSYDLQSNKLFEIDIEGKTEDFVELFGEINYLPIFIGIKNDVILNARPLLKGIRGKNEFI